MTDEELNGYKAAMFEALKDLLRALAAIADTARTQIVEAAASDARKVHR